VVIGARPVFGPGGGITRYTQELIRALWALDPYDLAIEGIALGRRWDLPALAAVTPQAPAHGPVQRLGEALARVLPLRQALLDHDARRLARALGPPLPDLLLHAPNFVAPAWGGRIVVTIHDLAFARLPETVPPDYVRHLERRVPETLARAERVLTPSAFTRSELAAVYGLDPTRVVVTPLGLSLAAAASDADLPGALVGVQGFFLAVGTLEPRKNLITLIRAHRALPAEVRRRFPLALAGRAGWLTQAERRELMAAERGGGVRWLDRIPDPTLALLYRRATALCFPSLYEGFGLPALEALAAGARILASDRGSLPEICGGHATHLDALDDAAWTRALAAAIDAPPPTEGERAGRRMHAESFTWERCARATAEVYRGA
jgi:alpha-1,3-rhamnosyl/mannosyltransferase